MDKVRIHRAGEKPVLWGDWALGVVFRMGSCTKSARCVIDVGAAPIGVRLSHGWPPPLTLGHIVCKAHPAGGLWHGQISYHPTGIG